MKKWIFYICAFLMFLSIYYIFHNDVNQPQISSTHQKIDDQLTSLLSHEERHQVSLTLAHLFWNQLSQYSPFYDFDEVMENLHDLKKGKIQPLQKHETQQQLFSFLHKIADYHDRLNLKAVEAYLSEIAGRENIVEVIPEKVYYEVLQSGTSSFASNFTIHLIESRLSEGEEVVMQDTRSSDKPISLVLSDTILGFAKGASGMACGERRKIYIHPDFAYGKYGQHGFQQLVICDVERL